MTDASAARTAGSFVIGERESGAFAALSGDFNPLHVDATYARRLQFGNSVVHGVHHFLTALEHAAAASPALDLACVTAVSVSYPNPVRTGHEVLWQCTHSGAGAAELSATCDGQRVLQATLTLAEATQHATAACGTREHARRDAFEQLFPPSRDSGAIPRDCNAALADELLPRVHAAFGPVRLAEMLGTTTVIGMECPGLHSVYSGLDLDLQTTEGDDAGLRFAVEHADQRFAMVRIRVDGAGLRGRLSAFFRPQPVAQASFETVKQRVAAAGQQAGFGDRVALVVGGSRGIGETTAKVLAAGGARVLVSYRSGRADADAVAAEITAGGGRCEVLALDVMDAAGTAATLGALDEASHPTHVYYFASPKIATSRTRGWDAPLFAAYADVYVAAFSELVDQVVALNAPHKRTTHFYYPSSIFVEQAQKGFAEYAAAKAAGEALCTQLPKRHRRATFSASRLPRMETDQTASIIPIKCENTLEVMLAEFMPA